MRCGLVVLQRRRTDIRLPRLAVHDINHTFNPINLAESWNRTTGTEKEKQTCHKYNSSWHPPRIRHRILPHHNWSGVGNDPRNSCCSTNSSTNGRPASLAGMREAARWRWVRIVGGGEGRRRQPAVVYPAIAALLCVCVCVCICVFMCRVWVSGGGRGTGSRPAAVVFTGHQLQ